LRRRRRKLREKRRAHRGEEGGQPACEEKEFEGREEGMRGEGLD